MDSLEITRLKMLISKLNELSISMVREKNIDTLIQKILYESIELTNSDGGSIYLVEENQGIKNLVIKYSINHSINFKFVGHHIPIDNNSIVGYVAKTAKPIIINNTEEENDFDFKIQKSYDQELNYKTLNIMTIPMIDYRDRVIGVLQVLNKKKNKQTKLTLQNIYDNICYYNQEDKEICMALSSQATVLIDRLVVYNQMEKNIANTRYALISLFNSLRNVISNLAEDLLIEQEEFKKYAIMDSLTGVLTRNEGISILEKQMQLAKINNVSIVVCFIDVNNLKQVNDTYGHQEGDHMLKTFAKILQDSIRNYDVVFRYGGDEFVLILYKITLNEANIVWQRILNKVEDYNKSYQKPYKISASHGFAEYNPVSQLSAEELLKIADEKMYQEKIIYKTKKGEV